MKRLLIASLVGSLILFAWQSLSWTALGIHNGQIAYTDKQDDILKALADSGVQPGFYFLPTVAPGGDSQAVMDAALGKPWARLSYFESLENNMGMNMFRGWVISFASAFLLAWILSQMAGLSMKTAVISGLSVGMIAWMMVTYQESIWFETDAMPQLLDAFIQWGLVGAWMGYYLPKTKS